MKISATSALVLNWTEDELWETPEAQRYFRRLDLSEGEPLLALFSKDEHTMHSHAVSNRKFFMKQQIVRFLASLPPATAGQVLILAAGLTPLSLEIASLYPVSRVFDVDRFLMKAKEKLTPPALANIEFVECDITDVGRLDDGLRAHGFDPAKPTIAVLEGIIYYITTAAFGDVLTYLSVHHVRIAGDFCLKPALVIPEHRKYAIEVFRKISEMVKLDFVTFYSDEEIAKTVSDAGFQTVNFTGMHEVQKQRTANYAPFEARDSGWLKLLSAG